MKNGVYQQMLFSVLHRTYGHRLVHVGSDLLFLSLLFIVPDTFNIREESHNYVLKSAGAKWRQFKANLTKKHVLPYVGHKKKLRRPPKQYGFVGRGPGKNLLQRGLLLIGSPQTKYKVTK